MALTRQPNHISAVLWAHPTCAPHAFTRRQYFEAMTTRVEVNGWPQYKVQGLRRQLFHWQQAWDICGVDIEVGHFTLMRLKYEAEHNVEWLSMANFIEYHGRWSTTLRLDHFTQMETMRRALADVVGHDGTLPVIGTGAPKEPATDPE